MNNFIELQDLEIPNPVDGIKSGFHKIRAKLTPKPYVSSVPTKAQEWLMNTFNQTDTVDKAYLALTEKKWFNLSLFVSILLIFIELILIAFDQNTTYIGQVLLLCLTTITMVSLYAIVVIYIKKIDNEMTTVSALKQALVSELYLELFFLLIGWIFLYAKSPFAIFRAFRIIRYLWYSEYYVADKNDNIIGFYVIFYSHLLLQYIEKLGIEIFTTATKGAATILGLYMFVTYIFAVVYWQLTHHMPLVSPEGGNSGTLSQCDTLRHCFLIMIRLTYADGDGFDYIKSLMDADHMFLATILYLYFLLSAIALINGLLGIFANSFSTIVLEKIEEIEQINQSTNKEIKLMKDFQRYIEEKNLNDLDLEAGHTGHTGHTRVIAE